MPPPDEDTTPKGPKDYPLPPVHPNKPWATHEYMAQQMAHRMAMFRWPPADMEAASAIAEIRDRGLPVLALLGAEDEILGPSQERTIRRALPHVDFRLAPEGGHDIEPWPERQTGSPSAMPQQTGVRGATWVETAAARSIRSGPGLAYRHAPVGAGRSTGSESHPPSTEQ